MNESAYLLVINLFLLLLSLAFLYMGGRGILTRKPFALRSRWLWLIMLVGFTPSILNSFRLIGDFGDLDIILLSSALMFVVVLGFMWFQLSGFIFFGITDEFFGEALRGALRSLNIPFEESLSKIRCTSLDAELQAGVQSWMGTAQLRIKPDSHNQTLGEIVGCMSDQFEKSPVPVNFTTYYFYIIVGILMLAMTFGLMYRF